MKRQSQTIAFTLDMSEAYRGQGEGLFLYEEGVSVISSPCSILFL